MTNPNEPVRWRQGKGDLTLDVSDIEGARFNFRVAILLYRNDGRDVMLHREKGSFHFLPGGRIKFGEPAAQAAARECAEEFTIADLKLEFAGQIENFFMAGTRPFHEVMQFFRAHLTADEVNRIRHEESDSTSAHWVPIDDAVAGDLRPEAVRRNLALLRHETLFLVHSDEAWRAARARG
jgi:8-oxo-dGTP pyrophosphatase MutT (NUDIX family)